MRWSGQLSPGLGRDRAEGWVFTEQQSSINDSLVSDGPHGSPHTGISSGPMPIKDEWSTAFVSFPIVKKPIRGALDPLDRVCRLPALGDR